MGVVVGKAEPVADPGVTIVGDNGVPQSSGLADQRQGAVAHRGELSDAAGLEQGWHEEKVGGSVDASGHGVVVGQLGSKFVPVAAGGLQKKRSVPVLTIAHDNKLNIHSEHFLADANNEIEPFLTHQP